jgi:hypothetical protein
MRFRRQSEEFLEVTQPARADDEYLGDMLGGHVITQIIASAVRFGLPDLLAHGSVSGRQLSLNPPMILNVCQHPPRSDARYSIPGGCTS